MYARVTWLEGSPSQAKDAIHGIRDLAIPALREQPGFVELLFLMDREGGRALAVTIWETPEDLEASEEAARRLRGVPIARWASSGVERFELALRAHGPSGHGG
jgi:heme-degrading monooxygenase HmoA